MKDHPTIAEDDSYRAASTVNEHVDYRYDCPTLACVDSPELAEQRPTALLTELCSCLSWSVVFF